MKMQNNWCVKPINENGLSLVDEFYILAENVDPEKASLIAAAPELLAWLKFITETYELDEFAQAEINRVIEKATR